MDFSDLGSVETFICIFLAILALYLLREGVTEFFVTMYETSNLKKIKVLKKTHGVLLADFKEQTDLYEKCADEKSELSRKFMSLKRDYDRLTVKISNMDSSHLEKLETQLKSAQSQIEKLSKENGDLKVANASLVNKSVAQSATSTKTKFEELVNEKMNSIIEFIVKERKRSINHNDQVISTVSSLNEVSHFCATHIEDISKHISADKKHSGAKGGNFQGGKGAKGAKGGKGSKSDKKDNSHGGKGEKNTKDSSSQKKFVEDRQKIPVQEHANGTNFVIPQHLKVEDTSPKQSVQNIEGFGNSQQALSWATQ